MWALCAAAIIVGVLGWLFAGRAPWVGFGAAGVIAGVTQLVARVKGIPAWPWDSWPEA
jgi:hypothetical protein